MNKAIISDSSCLIALSKIDHLHLLKNLFEQVAITYEVKQEFGEPIPDWIVVKKVSNRDQQLELETSIDKGEASSIALALEMNHAILIIDELKGRKMAESLKVKIIGTIGILVLAHKKGLIEDIRKSIQMLSLAGFRISKDLINSILDNI